MSLLVENPHNIRFDYSRLGENADLARSVRDRIKTLHRDAIIESGRELLKIKAALEHGCFTAWVEAELGFAPTTARNYMRAAEMFGDEPATVAVLPPGVLYVLASAPDEVRLDVVRRAQTGDVASRTEVRNLVLDHKEQVARSAHDAKLTLQDKQREAAAAKRRASLEEKRRREWAEQEQALREKQEGAADRLITKLVAHFNDEDLFELDRLWTEAGPGVVRNILLRRRGEDR